MFAYCRRLLARRQLAQLVYLDPNEASLDPPVLIRRAHDRPARVFAYCGA
jgi:hypothetical protein